MIGDHQRESHSASRARDAVALDERRVRLVPLRPLPARGLVEYRAERLLALVHRRDPQVAVARPLLGRMDDPVRLREGLEVRAFTWWRVFWCSWKRLMSEVWRSMSDSPLTIHSASDLPTPGPS